MNISTTASSNSYSPYIAWPKHYLQNQKASLKQKINGSYAFTTGNQSCDEQYNKLFLDLFREMRGGERIVDESSWRLANSLCDERISDRKERVIYEPEEEDRIEVSYHPTEEFKKELRELLELHDGLSDQFLEALQENQKKLKDSLDLKARDTYCAIPILSRVFPRFYETLQGIFADLLAVEYLDEQGVLKINLMEPRLWEQALAVGYRQKKRDVQLAIEHEKAWASDKNNLLISAGISGATGNPIFLVAQTLRNIANAIARNTDPEREDVLTQALPLITNTASAAINGITKELAVRLALDLADLASDRKDGDFAISMSKALITGCVHGDEERYLKEILSAVLSEASSNVSSETLVGTAVKHPDVHGLFVDHFLEKQRPKPQELEESKTQEPIAVVESEPKITTQIEEIKERIEQQKAIELEAQKQYDQELVEYNKKAAYVESVNKAAQDIKDKQAQLRRSSYNLEERLEKLNKKKHRKSLWKKAKKATKKVNIANTDLHNNINHYNALTGSSERVHPTKIKKPEKPSWDDRLGSRLAAIGFESINVSVGVPLYPTTTPNITDRNLTEPTPPVLPTPPSINEPKPREFSYQDVQKVQEQRILETNMAYRPPSLSQPQQTQYSPNIGQWGRGVARNVQRPPVNTRDAQQSGVRQQQPQRRVTYASFGFPMMQTYQEVQSMQRAIDNDFIKNIPKGVGQVAKALLSMTLPEMSGRPGATCPRKEFQKICRNLGKLYDKKVQIQDPNSFNSRAGRFTGEMVALGGVGRVVRVAEGVSVFARACEGGFYGAIVAEANGTNRVAGIAFGFTAGGAFSRVSLIVRNSRAKPLLDRALVRPQGVGRQVQFLKRLNQPVCHSGIGNPFSEMVAVERPLPTKTIEQLKNRSIKQIRTDWVFPKKGGATINGRWYTEHALERMAPRTPEVMAELESRFVERAKIASEKLPHEDFLKWYKKNYPNPRGIPPSVIEAEIARPGSTGIRVVLNENGDIVTAIPGGL